MTVSLLIYVTRPWEDSKVISTVGLNIIPFTSSSPFLSLCGIGREQSFNCGRNPEYVDTIAYLAARKGSSFYVASSGSVMPVCNKSMDSIPYSREDWTPKLVPNLTPWMPSRDDLKKIKQRMLEVNSLASSADRSQQSSFPLLFDSLSPPCPQICSSPEEVSWCGWQWGQHVDELPKITLPESSRNNLSKVMQS
jgi:hypothetical protein